MTNRAWRTAIVGCGRIGMKYAEVLKDIDVGVAATSDPDIGRAQAVAAVSGGQAYADIDTLLTQSDIDVVCVCSTTASHHPISTRVARTGKHLFLEKPMAASLNEAQDILQAMEATDAAFGFGFKMRFEPVYREAKRIVDSGEIGEPTNVVITHNQPTPAGERAWYLDVGIVHELLIHSFDIANWWLGARPVTTRAATSALHGRKGEDRAVVEFHYPSDCRVCVYGGYYDGFPDVAGGTDSTFQIVGTQGFVIGTRPDHLRIIGNGRTRELRLEPHDAFQAELAGFFAALDSANEPPVTGRDGLYAQAMAAAALKSAASGAAQPVLAEARQ